MIAVVLIGDLVVAMVHQVRGHVRRRQDRIVQKHRIHFHVRVALRIPGHIPMRNAQQLEIKRGLLL